MDNPGLKQQSWDEWIANMKALNEMQLSTLEPQGDLVPLVEIEGDDNIILLAQEWSHPDEERRFATAFGICGVAKMVKAKRLAVRAMCYVTEKEAAKPMLIRPSQDPDRIEAVLIFACDDKGQQTSVVGEVKREDGKPPCVTSWRTSHASVASGRFKMVADAVAQVDSP